MRVFAAFPLPSSTIRSHALRIVIGPFQRFAILPQIDAQQEAILAGHRAADAPKKSRRLIAFEISHARPQPEYTHRTVVQFVPETEPVSVFAHKPGHVQIVVVIHECRRTGLQHFSGHVHGNVMNLGITSQKRFDQNARFRRISAA